MEGSKNVKCNISKVQILTLQPMAVWQIARKQEHSSTVGLSAIKQNRALLSL